MSYDNEYYCPHCGAVLNDQYGFDPDNDSWTCTSCAQELYGDDVYDGDAYPGVMWYCDDCGALLNKQSGFSDDCGSWFCSECGHLNAISEDEIYESKADYEEKKSTSYWNDGDDDGDDDDDDDDDCVSGRSEFRYSPEFNTHYQQHGSESPKGRGKEQQKQLLIRLWRIITRRKQVIEISSISCRGKKYEEVYSLLKEREFYNVTTKQMEDLPYERIGEEGIVANVLVNEKNDFDAASKIPFDADIVIYYHTLKKAEVPVTSSSAKGKNVNDVLERFRNAGFVDIKTEAIYDLLKGWVKKNDSIEEVLIDGRRINNRKERFRLDSVITIKYHTFKSNMKGK